MQFEAEASMRPSCMNNTAREQAELPMKKCAKSVSYIFLIKKARPEGEPIRCILYTQGSFWSISPEMLGG